jgi:hypothetical protein
MAASAGPQTRRIGNRRAGPADGALPEFVTSTRARASAGCTRSVFARKRPSTRARARAAAAGRADRPRGAPQYARTREGSPVAPQRKAAPEVSQYARTREGSRRWAPHRERSGQPQYARTREGSRAYSLSLSVCVAPVRAHARGQPSPTTGRPAVGVPQYARTREGSLRPPSSGVLIGRAPVRARARGQPRGRAVSPTKRGPSTRTRARAAVFREQHRFPNRWPSTRTRARAAARQAYLFQTFMAQYAHAREGSLPGKRLRSGP